MLNSQKIITYIGFAIKSRKIKYGVDDILKLKKASLILVSETLTSSGMNKLNNYVNRTKTDMILLKGDDFSEIITSPSIKVAAILDDNIAEAIKKNLTNN